MFNKATCRKELGVTLSDKLLANIEQYIAAFHDHSLDGQVLTDVLGFTDFVVHNLFIYNVIPR